MSAKYAAGVAPLSAIKQKGQSGNQVVLQFGHYFRWGAQAEGAMAIRNGKAGLQGCVLHELDAYNRFHDAKPRNYHCATHALGSAGVTMLPVTAASSNLNP